MKAALRIAILTFVTLVDVAATEEEPASWQRWGDLPESDRVEVMREWNSEREEAQQSFEALLAGAQPGGNGSAVLDAAAGLARLAIAEGDYEALPRRLDRPLGPDQLAAVRRIVDSRPAQMLPELLREYEDLEYAYRPLEWPNDYHGAVEIMQVVRLLPTVAAVQAEGGDFGTAYETLTLLFPVADWLITERPVNLNGILASAAVREGVRHIEELAQRLPPSGQQVAGLNAVLLRGRAALDLAAVLEGDAAYSQWTAIDDLHSWREFQDYGGWGEYWTILQEASDTEPWARDRSNWASRVEAETGMPMPEIESMIDGFFETRFRIDLGLEMLDYYADGTPPEFPLDPFTGDPLRWRKAEDGCVVYSIGRNREDDGGVDRWEGKGHFDAVWRLPCDLIPAELGQASNPAAS